MAKYKAKKAEKKSTAFSDFFQFLIHGYKRFSSFIYSDDGFWDMQTEKNRKELGQKCCYLSVLYYYQNRVI